MVQRLTKDRRNQLPEKPPLSVARSSSLGRHRQIRMPYFHCALGVVAAALVFELCLRPFVADDLDKTRIRTVRNYMEGFSLAHFESDGIGRLGTRITGNPQVSGAPEGIIIGDSHVAADAVRDGDTMGAVVERLSRASGHPLNVRQYGWPRANAGTFIALAKCLAAKRNPVWIAVVMNSYNLSVNALSASDGWRIEVLPDYSVRLIQAPDRQRTLLLSMVAHSAKSVLTLALWRRLGSIWAQHAAGSAGVETKSRLSDEVARVPRATVQSLKQVGGAWLFIVYAPPMGVEQLEPIETELRLLCAEHGVGFLSVRQALIRDRDEHGRLSRGFHNTAPGIGHFNATGHRIIGQEIWRYLSTRSLPPPSNQ